nr:MAG TPA: hypothetical protein [Caudoviricetes sp.]
MITEAEKLEILDELEKRLDGRLKKIPELEVSGRILKAPREKWFSNADGYCGTSLMGEVFGSGQTAWEAWEAIRKLTCAVCGVRKVRELKTVEEAPIVAEKICQYIYDLAVEFKEEKKRV